MATIKSYTDIEQSRALAKILPIETADCFWDYDEMQKFHRISWFEDGFNKESQLMLNENNVCAWSLTALISVIPKPDLVQNSEGTWLVNSWVNAYPWSVGGYSNPVDACVAMIEKLHEHKML